MLKFSGSILDIIHWNIFRIISFHLGLIEREQQYNIFALFQNIKGGITFFFFFFWEWRGKLLDFKVWGWIVNYPKHKMMKSVLILSFCFYFLFLCVCKTMCFYLKWCIKKKKIQNTKIQPKKTVCEIVNFGSKKID